MPSGRRLMTISHLYLCITRLIHPHMREKNKICFADDFTLCRVILLKAAVATKLWYISFVPTKTH